MTHIEALKFLEQGLVAVKNATFSPDPTDDDFDRQEVVKMLLAEVVELLGD